MTSTSRALEDLADSFPALLFALATGYGTSEQRRRALECIEQGLPLKAASEALGVPMWLRRFPSASFSAPLPPMAEDAEFGQALAGRAPPRREDAAIWLERILCARATAGRDFALWLARDKRLLPPATNEEDFQLLVAWGWHSFRPEAPASRLLRQPWHDGMAWKKAREEVSIWRKRIDLAAALGSGIEDPWFADGQALGLEIRSLRTVEDFIAESAAMENCLDQYAGHLAYGRVRVFAVRKEGRSVASLELSLRSDDVTVPSISQLRGPRNRRAPTYVWQAAHAWLGAQQFKALKSGAAKASHAGQVLARLWRPYVEALERAGQARFCLPMCAALAQVPRVRVTPAPHTS